jgi:SAM-dependent methyltransferase
MNSRRDVANYYDRNTWRFLRFGGGGSSHAIHRQLWGPGITTAEAAAGYVNRRVAEEIRGRFPQGPGDVIDMGCGVGGTVFHLAGAFPNARFVGVTISPRQRDIAVRLTKERDLEERCRFLEGDFQNTDLGGVADLIVAIEAFVHSDSPQRFFAAAAAHLNEGGFAILVDDFLADNSDVGEAARGHIAKLREGWRLPTLCTVGECVRSAELYGLRLIREVDLTELIRLGRPRDRLIAFMSPLFDRLGLTRLPFFGNMVGGNALQIGLRHGFLRYHLVLFQKEARSP